MLQFITKIMTCLTCNIIIAIDELCPRAAPISTNVTVQRDISVPTPAQHLTVLTPLPAEPPFEDFGDDEEADGASFFGSFQRVWLLTRNHS